MIILHSILSCVSYNTTNIILYMCIYIYTHICTCYMILYHIYKTLYNYKRTSGRGTASDNDNKHTNLYNSNNNTK